MVVRTKGVNWSGIAGLVAAVLVVAFFAWLLRDQVTTTPSIVSDQNRPSLATTTPQVGTTTTPLPPDPTGVYQPYAPAQLVTLPANARVVLFFTADNCSSCTQTDIELLDSLNQIPADVFIYTVQYTEAVQLRRRYSVASPHTFVQIDTLGNSLQSWRGSTDLQSILARLR